MSGDLIQAGTHLYAAGVDSITAIKLPQDGAEAKVAWSMPSDGQVVRLLAASDRLFAVTLDGRILAYGQEKVDKVLATLKEIQKTVTLPDQEVLKEADVKALGKKISPIVDMLYGVKQGV